MAVTLVGASGEGDFTTEDARRALGHHGILPKKESPTVKITSAKVDSAAIQSSDGVWQDDLPELGDIAVLVRGINNRHYRLKFEAMVRALPPSKRKNGSV